MSTPTAPLAQRPPGPRAWLFPLAMAALVVLPALFPSDAQWVNDEPLLIGNALTANQQHVLATSGLMGTRGVAYGPLPTWLYQLFLVFSNDLVLLVALRALATTALTALALVWLGRTLTLWRWFPAVVLCSPILWFYARTLWDNSFMIPVSALALASYADFLRTPRARTLLITLGCLWCLPMIHLMSLSFVVPFGLHLLWFSRRGLWRFRAPVAGLALVLGGLSLSYARYLWGAHGDAGGAHLAPLRAWLFPLWGALFISAWNIDQVVGAEWLAGQHGPLEWAVWALRLISGLALPLCWLGFALAGRAVWAASRLKAADTRTHVVGLCLAIAGCQAVLGGLSDRYGLLHYFNATWAAYAVLTWFAVDALRERKAVGWATAVGGAASLGVLVLVIARIHHTGGSRDLYMATLGNQRQIARGLARYAPDSELAIDVSQYRDFPHALSVLRQLEPPPPAGATLPRASLRVTYLTAGPTEARLQLLAP